MGTRPSFVKACRRGAVRRWLVVGTAASVVVAGSLVAASAGASAAAEPVVEAPSEAAAVAAAVRSGRRVEVSSARSELTQVFAEPSGRLTLEAAAVPQRARRVDGSWAPVDLALHRAGDGLWRPAVSVADVRFSGGGLGPLVTLVRDGRTLTMSWPGVLPAPSVSGEQATYAEVLPGVDLVVRATWTGFTHVLVVKSAAAAANPAVRTIRLRLGGDARVVSLPGGGLRAVAGDRLLAAAEPAAMWDSAAPAPAVAARIAAADGAAGGGLSESTPAGPGEAANTARVTAQVSDAELVLTPDPALLTADAAFPVFVDPAWSVAKSRWAYAASDNRTNSDATTAWVGLNPVTGAVFRSYFDFPISAIRGKHIESAYVQMKLDHSWSCDGTYSHMFNTSGIASTPRTRWAPTNKRWMAATASHANEAGGCGVIQDDMIVNFRESTTTVIQDHATKNATLITIGFCACNADGDYERSQDRWKKFFPNDAKLIVDYDSIPGQPTGPQVSGVACAASGRMSIGTLSPTLSAVYPDADSTQALTAAWEWLEIPASGVYTDATPRRPAPGTKSVPASGRATSAALAGVVAGKAYAWRTRATDPAPYSRTGAWSAWCEFTTDTSVPAPPTITVVDAPAGPGQPGTFTITSTESDVVKFRYGWSSPPLNEIAASGTTTKTATVTVTAPRYGQNILYAYAIDTTANKGNDASYEFTVGRPSPAVARWGLETYPSVDQTAALADRQPTLAGDTPLSVSNVAWADDVRLIGGRTPDFDNSSTSAMTTTAPVVDADGSFGVAAWLRIKLDGQTLPTVNKAAVTQDGDKVSSFVLGYRGDTKRWGFWLHLTDTNNSPTVWVTSPTSPVLGAWTHVAGVYDAAEKQIRLYVNGEPVAATAVTTTPNWSTARKIGLGRDLWNGAFTGYWNGSIADVQIFDRALVAHDFTGQTAADPTSGGFNELGIYAPVEVGNWDFGAAMPCYEPGIPDTCLAPYSGTFATYLKLASGVTVGLGQRDAGLLLDATHWVEDPFDPYYGTATQEYGWSQRNVAAEGDPPLWQDTPVLRTDQSFTVSAWVNPEVSPAGNGTAVGQDGTTVSGFYLGIRKVSGVDYWSFMLKDTDTATSTSRYARSTGALTADDFGRWTHLVGVYDVHRNEIRLYVDGVLQGTPVARPVTSWQAGGRLTVGGALYGGVTSDWWIGGLDDVVVYQGAHTDAAVAQLHQAQSASTEP